MPTLGSLCQRIGRSGRKGGAAPRNARRAQLLLALFLAAGFAAVAGKAIYFASALGDLPMLAASTSPLGLAKSRPDIVDRKGRILATDVRIYWLAANPRQIGNADDAAEKIAALFPDLDQAALTRKFRDKSSRFEWVKRGLTPKQAEAAHTLGIPALSIFATNQRFYPAGNEAAHILGVTNVDNEGLSGIERYLDAVPQAASTVGDRAAVRLALDLGLQHVLTEELTGAMQRYGAAAAFGIVLNVNNGEVLASVSLPDFDPNRREQTMEQNRQNRVVTDVYELGSVFKSFTIAMALDLGVADRYDLFDTSPLTVGHFVVRDPHSKRPMTMEDIFVHSSNTGAVRIAMAVGTTRQQNFLRSLGLFEKLETEAGSSPKPVFPEVWRPANAATIAYGHGIAVPPLLLASAIAALVNGGTRIKPTFLALEHQPAAAGERVIRPETSAIMREMMRLVVERGTGRRAAVAGLDIGGKTGTAIKVKDGIYTHDVMNSFVAVIPINDPKYLVMVTLDEPKAEEPNKPNEASSNAAPTVGAIIKRIAPMLDILPTARFDEATARPYEQPGFIGPPHPFFRKRPYETSGLDQRYSAVDKSEGNSRSRDPWGYGR